jgi:hypothetical protein
MNWNNRCWGDLGGARRTFAYNDRGDIVQEIIEQNRFDDGRHRVSGFAIMAHPGFRIPSGHALENAFRSERLPPQGRLRKPCKRLTPMQIS